jgi:ADP-ribose pyrophosphatase
MAIDLLAGDDGSTGQLLSLSPAALDALLASGDEPLDGRTLTAWFLARCRW